MNIIQVCPYDLSMPGGVQTHVTHLSNQLVRKNHKVIVFAPSLTKSGLERKFECEVKYITGSRRRRLWGTSIDVSLLNRKEKQQVGLIFEEFKPDVIHFHTIWNPVMQTQLMWMTPNGVKKVGTFHDTPPDKGYGKYVAPPLMKLGAKYYLKKVDEIISVSETQSAAMGIDQNNSPDNFRIIPNGIDSVAAKSTERIKSTLGEFRMIFIGRFEKRKGIFDLLKVYKRLQEAEPDKKLSLKLLGHGPQMTEVKNFVTTHALNDITFHLDTSDEEKDRHLADSDLMISPALYGESFGIVLLEAMAHEVKVAGYGNQGYMNIGRLYGEENFPPPGDKDALFDLIKEHVEHPERTDHLIKEGLKIAEQHDWQLITRQVEGVYNR